MKLSIIIPAYNEEGNTIEIYKVIKETLKDILFEIIFIDDGSSDNTLINMEKLYEIDKNIVKIISFSRNFGKDAAIYAGMKYAVGDYICIIDADMEQHPKYILKMLIFLENHMEYDQVAMVIKERKNSSFVKRVGSKYLYKILNKLSDINFIEDASDFRLFRSYVKDAILSLPEKNRFSKGIFSWVGFKTKVMEYEVGKRYSGKTKFTLKKSIKYAIDGIVGYSVKPLRLATVMGLITSTFGFVYLIYVIVKTLILGKDTPGFATIVCLILFIGGIQLICIGILGEYMAKTFIETKNRPIYVEKEKRGIEEDLL